MSASVCAALIWKRIVSSPFGTTGKVRPTARMPRSKSPRPSRARVPCRARASGTTGCGPGMDSNPSDSSPRRNCVVRACRFASRARPSALSATSMALHRRGGVGRAERVRVDVGVRLLPHRFDELGAAGDESAVDAERLAERADEDVDARAAVLFGAASGRSVGGDAVRIVHHRDDAIAESVSCRGDERRDRVDRRVVAAHAEDAVEDHDDASGVRRAPAPGARSRSARSLCL